jgi:hypothetical protein
MGKPWIARLLTVAATVTVVVAGMSGVASAQAVGGPITGLAAKCMDVNNGSNVNGTVVQLWTCVPGIPAQQWSIKSDGTIRAVGKCLDVAGGSSAPGTRVQIWSCNGTGAQQWVEASGQLVNPQSGRCLDVTGASTADGTPLQIWDCTGAGAQQWNPYIYEIISPNLNSCVDDFNVTIPGTVLTLESCHGTASNGIGQRWKLYQAGSDTDGRPYYLIQNQASLLCMYVDGSITFGQLVIQQRCLADGRNQWKILDSSTGFFNDGNPRHFELRFFNTNFCLDTANNHANLVLQACVPGIGRLTDIFYTSPINTD